MEFSGKQIIRRPPDELWRILLDPTTIRRCLPGCESVEARGAGSFDVVISVGVGFLRGRFRGSLEFIDLEPPSACRIAIDARGTGGNVQGLTHVRLTELEGGGGTELVFAGRARLEGLIAKFGSDLFQGTARGMQEEFFVRLAAL